jgi:hypothetical protein
LQFELYHVVCPLTSIFVIRMMTRVDDAVIVPADDPDKDPVYGIAEAVETARADPQALTAGEVLQALVELRRVREELAGWEPELIAAGRRLGISWAELAPALGVASRQAAERRYLRLRPSESSEQTADGRVRAERDRRAGERAVTEWARRNSASLRRLAGQVSSLANLGGAAQRRVDIVHRALALDDAAELLQPLSGARFHLRPTHPELAEQIGVIAETTDQLRRDVQDRRRG